MRETIDMSTNVVLDTATSMTSPSAARLPPVAKALMSKMAIVTDEVRTRWIPGADFHMQAQVFTEKVSCQGLFWKEK